ncbi:MAG: TlpA family protein disulfide reductase [Nitrospirae bacterium]|nr:TlpA family protein disulfide reductase [Nitrospirota bacterium]
MIIKVSRIVIAAFLALTALAGAGYAAEKAFDFTLTDLNGTPHRLSDFQGKVVLVNFWASWCRECVIEMPSLNGFYAANKNKGIVVLGITIDRKIENVLDALRKTPVSYPVLLDSRGDVFVKKYTVLGLPTTIIIDREGNIQDRFIGRVDFSDKSLTEKIQSLLKGRNDR